MAIPTKPAGWPWWSLALGGLILVGIAYGLIQLGRSWDPLHGLLSWLGRPRREHVAKIATPASFEPEKNGTSRVYLPTSGDEEWRKEQERLRKLLEAQQRQTEKLLAELEAIKRRKAETEPKTEGKEKKLPTLKRASGIKISHVLPPETTGRPTYGLAPGATKIPCQIEMAMNSDVGNSYFTCKVTRPIKDTRTGQHELISQGDTVLARDEGANITVGNELLPAFAMTLSRREGDPIDLGQAPVADAIGINGLMSDVNHHWARNILAGLMLGTIRAGRQVIQQGVANEAGALVGAPGQVVERQLGRGIDSRPTITVDPGELANVILLKELQLTEVH